LQPWPAAVEFVGEVATTSASRSTSPGGAVVVTKAAIGAFSRSVAL